MNCPPTQHSQIVVIGAGPVGVMAALSLQRQGWQVLLLEARPAGVPSGDKRTLALSHASLAALAEAGIVVPETDTTPIVDVHISQQGHPGRTLLRAADLGLPLLGRSCDYAQMLRACEAALAQSRLPVAWQTPVQRVQTLSHYALLTVDSGGHTRTLTADWVVLAEGGHLCAGLPGIRQHSYDYRQSALVSTLYFDAPPAGVAYERFADAGPFALLPYHDAYRLVWTRTPVDAERLMALDFDAFAAEFHAAFGLRLGRLRARCDSAAFPLQLKQLNRVYSGRVLCIGNAAQTMHPVAAQGLNLGVRDAAALAQQFVGLPHLQQPQLGARYAAQRRLDAHAIVGFTHSLVTVFDQPGYGRKLGRGAVMAALDAVPAWRRSFTRKLVHGL